MPDLDKNEFVEELVETGNVTIERIISKGHTSPTSGWYDQEKNEWVLVVKGCATLLFENGVNMEMQAGDFINIPAHTKHQVAWTDPDEETIWIAVFY